MGMVLISCGCVADQKKTNEFTYGKETEDGGMDGSQVSLLIYPGACVRAFVRFLSKSELHHFLIGGDAVWRSNW